MGGVGWTPSDMVWNCLWNLGWSEKWKKYGVIWGGVGWTPLILIRLYIFHCIRVIYFHYIRIIYILYILQQCAFFCHGRATFLCLEPRERQGLYTLCCSQSRTFLEPWQHKVFQVKYLLKVLYETVDHLWIDVRNEWWIKFECLHWICCSQSRTFLSSQKAQKQFLNGSLVPHCL